MARFFSYLTTIVNKNAYTARLFNYIVNNPLYRGVLVLGSGTAVAQLIGIVTAPIITRLYTPSDMGVLAVYSSILAIFGVGATLRYEFAYALPRENEDAINLFGFLIELVVASIIGSAALFADAADFLEDFLINMLVVTATSSRHARSLADEVVKQCKEAGVSVRGVEGQEQGEWVLIDLGDVLVHVMQAAVRKLYDLESLWKLAPASSS